jgi:outer membrane phospholipase A
MVSSAAANPLITLISCPGPEAMAGRSMECSVFFHNEGQEDLEFNIPKELQILASSGSNTAVPMTAFSAEEGQQIILPPGSFQKRKYALSVPSELQGVYFFSLAGFPGTGSKIMVRAAEDNQGTEEPASAKVVAKTEKYPDLKSFFPLYQSYTGNFSAHQPLYFLVGTDPKESKFQFSFKYRPINPSSALGQKYEWLTGLHLAYTQISFWDLTAKSLPFEDTSYMPQIMYLSRNILHDSAWIDGLFIDSGFIHESNGRGGDDSRGANTVYVKPIAMFYDETSQLGLSISPSIREYVRVESHNSDLADYRGYFELESAFGKAHSYMLATTFRFAEEGVSFQADLTYPLGRLLHNNFDLFLMAQYSNSLAERLLDYQERNETLRLGFSLVR